jgi:cytochrome c oxidase cbb3-type subunit 4
MDLMTVRIVWTVVSFAVFMAIMVWAYSERAGRGFDAAARLPFEEGDDEAAQRRVRESDR